MKDWYFGDISTWLMLVDASCTDVSTVSFGHSDSSLTKNSGPLDYLQYSFRFSNLVAHVVPSSIFMTPGI